MDLRIDKVIRLVGLGRRKVYSLVLSDEGLYLIQTGGPGALKHYRLDRALNQIVIEDAHDRGVKELQTNEGRIDTTPLDRLLNEGGNYFVRLEAIEDVKIKAGQSPEMLIQVSGSEHYLIFPFASLEEVQTLQRTLNKWGTKS